MTSYSSIDSSSSEHESTSSFRHSRENSSTLQSISLEDKFGVAKEEVDNTEDKIHDNRTSKADKNDAGTKDDHDSGKDEARLSRVAPWLALVGPLPMPKSRDRGRSPQADRFFRRSALARRKVLQSQIQRGRGDPSVPWCLSKECLVEGYVFRSPDVYLFDVECSRLNLPVKSYLEAFAQTMTDSIFPEVTEKMARVEKVRSLLSFVDSPPVRAAFWKFNRGYNQRELNLSEKEFQKELVAARPQFQNLMFGGKTRQQVELVHEYMEPTEDQLSETWTLQDIMIRFLVTAELWRQHETPRSASWRIGSRQRVTEFLTAILHNFQLMSKDECFEREVIMNEKQWDDIWEEWLARYPFGGDDDGFIVRDWLDATEDEVLEEFGYLGGIGKFEGYELARRRLGRYEDILMDE